MCIRDRYWIDRFKAWWQKFWVPGYYKYAENIYHMHQTNRAWNDWIKFGMYPLKINYQTLRDLRELGAAVIPYMLGVNPEYRKFLIKRMDTFFRNLLINLQTDIVTGLRREKADENKVKKIERKETPQLSYGELNDILDDVIVGAIKGAANEAYVAVSKKFNEHYGNIIPGIGRAIDRKDFIDHLTDFFSAEYEGWVKPFIESYGQLIPKAKFTYIPGEEKKKDKEESSTPSLGLLGLAGIK